MKEELKKHILEILKETTKEEDQANKIVDFLENQSLLKQNKKAIKYKWKDGMKDHEIISLVNKKVLKEKLNQPGYIYLAICREIKKELQINPLSTKEINEIADRVIANPPALPEKPKPVVLTQEEKDKIRKEKLQEENKHTIEFLENGQEILTFSEKGMENILREDNEEFITEEKATISDHEDDGRMYKNQVVTRKSDNKRFYFNYVWCPEPYPDYFLETKLFSLK